MEKLSQETLEHATFGLISLLQQKAFVSDIKIQEYKPVQMKILNSWEESNDCKLPSDLKQFYQTMNGLLIQWKVRFQDKEVPIGCVEINPVETLNNVALRLNKNDYKLHFLDLDEVDYDAKGRQRPRYSDKIFELSSDGKHGKVCLVYKDDVTIPEIWLLDLSLQWHYLACTFRHYYRMLITHLGIRGWQYLYTDFGPSPEVKQWFGYCLPHRLNSKSTEADLPHTEEGRGMKVEHNKVDFNALFKQKTKTEKKAVDAHNKKKKPQGNKTSIRPSSKLSKNLFK